MEVRDRRIKVKKVYEMCSEGNEAKYIDRCGYRAKVVIIKAQDNIVSGEIRGRSHPLKSR